MAAALVAAELRGTGVQATAAAAAAAAAVAAAAVAIRVARQRAVHRHGAERPRLGGIGGWAVGHGPEALRWTRAASGGPPHRVGG